MWLQHEWMKKKLNGFFLYIEVRTWLEKKKFVYQNKRLKLSSYIGLIKTESWYTNS